MEPCEPVSAVEDQYWAARDTLPIPKAQLQSLVVSGDETLSSLGMVCCLKHSSACSLAREWGRNLFAGQARLGMQGTTKTARDGHGAAHAAGRRTLDGALSVSLAHYGRILIVAIWMVHIAVASKADLIVAGYKGS